MSDFAEKLRLKEKAEEDIYFARLDRALIEALHRKRDRTARWMTEEQKHEGDRPKW